MYKKTNDNNDFPVFITIKDAEKILPWGKNKVRDLFNEKDFPACNYGKEKIVRLDKFNDYFAVRRDKENATWKKENPKDE